MRIPAIPYLPPYMPTDGCTMPHFLRVLLGGKRYVLWCKEHDFLRRYHVVSVMRANFILSYRIAHHHHGAGWIRAPLYFLATTLTWPLYRSTQPLPAKYRSYASHYSEKFL